MTWKCGGAWPSGVLLIALIAVPSDDHEQIKPLPALEKLRSSDSVRA